MRSRTATRLAAQCQALPSGGACGDARRGAQLSTDASPMSSGCSRRSSFNRSLLDNIRASSSDRDADGITSLTARLNAALRTDHIEAVARVEATYNEVWAANDLDGFDARGDRRGAGPFVQGPFCSLMRWPNVNRSLWNRLGRGAMSLTGQGQQQETDYGVSPTLTTDLFDLADLAVRATYAQVFFDDPVAGPSLTPLDDVALKEISGRIGTGKRASLYEATVSANYLETDTDFQRRNIIGSLFLNLTGQFTAIGRIGYERITDPSIAQIRGPLWSAGGRYNLGKNSLVQVEYGPIVFNSTM